MASSVIRIPNIDIVYKEAFLMQPLYRVVRQWLVENSYTDQSGDASMESSGEIMYLFRHGTHHSPNENELRIWWRTVKNSGVFDDIYKHHLDIDWNVIQMKDMEIMRDGKRLKVQHGELRISIRPTVELRVDITTSPIIKFFDRWFKERLIKKNLEEHKKMLYLEAYRLQGMIKKYLELKSFTPDIETFHERFEMV